MRKVFSSFEEVARVWAARSQDEGRSGNGHFFFEGDVAYSYRWSFPVAAMFDAPDGRTFCFVQGNSPSTSTSAVRSMAAAAAREAGCVMIEVPSIGAAVELFSRPKRKIGVRALNIIKDGIEREVARLGEMADRTPDNSWAQGSRLATMASLLKAHADLAGTFGLDWPSPRSAESCEARAEMAFEVARNANIDKRRKEQAERRRIDRRAKWETENPLPPAQELAQWRRGERMSLRHQEGGAAAPIRARIVDGRFSTDRGGVWSYPQKEFSRLLNAAVAVVAGDDDAKDSVRFGKDYVRIHGNGDVNLGWQTVIHFDELMACAEVGAPRLHARAVAAIEAAGAEPAGMAP